MIKTYRRNTDVAEKIVDDVVFLAHLETGGLYQMNATGRALWTLLKDGITRRQAAKALCAAFPNENASQIKTDIARVLDEMMENDLIA